MCDAKFYEETKTINPNKVSREFCKNNLLRGTLNMFFGRGHEKKMDLFMTKELMHMVYCSEVKLSEEYLTSYKSRTLKMLKLKFCYISPS